MTLAFGGAITVPGLWDLFDRADGSAVGNGWTDMAAGSSFYAPAKIQGGRLGIGTAAGLGQFGIYRPVGLTDGVEVTVRQRRKTAGFSGTLDDIGWQPGPTMFVDPAGADGQKGLALYWDISLTDGAGHGIVFLNGLFDDSDYLNSAHYVTYDSNWIDLTNVHVDQDAINNIRLRCFGGKVAGFWNGQRIVGPIDIPAWAIGRDGWGANNIMASAPISNIGNIDVVRIRPWATSLGSYPSTPSVGTPGATNKATTAASIALAYPTVVAGDLLHAVVATINGTMTTPAGWHSDGVAVVTSDIRAQIFTKIADGTESGTLTVARASGSGHMCGFIVAVEGHNPLPPGHAATGQANTASTSLTAPSGGIAGQNRLVIWVGATGGNTAITVPSGFTSIANCGTAGAAINLAAGWKSFAATTGTLVGTLGASVTSVGLTQIVIPDPR